MIATNRAWMTTRAALALAVAGVVGQPLLASACGALEMRPSQLFPAIELLDVAP
jgi:hypothetical protein